ncbi:MAG: hypothetical protein R3A45_00975 [Bdellovibrionota bacterium]|nr:hypothetical protein [Deltaproteobacteria bacterium]
MKSVYTFFLITMIALSANADDNKPKKADQDTSFQSTETFTYTLPESFSAQSDTDETSSTEQQDEEQRKKLIENIRKLYHAQFI